MKKFNLFLLAVLGVTSLFAAKLEQVIVRQQWPWSTDVKIEYKLSGVTAPVDIAVKAYNGDVELDQSKVASALIGDRYGISEDGVGTIVLDPVKAFGTEKVALANFKVKLLLSDSAENMNEVLYRVFTIASGECAPVRRRDLLNGKYGDYEAVGDTLVWTAVTNGPKYKTTHLVMRKIPAAGQEWTMGSPETDPYYKTYGGRELAHQVKFLKNYYMGVFPVTQAQWTGIMGAGTAFAFGGRADSGSRPAESIAYKQMRGALTADAVPESSSFIYKLNDRANAAFDLPTDAQWEYACRAGTATALYGGCAYSEAEVKRLGWVSQNSESETHEVGLKLPNNWGLYDLVGNVREIVLDRYSDGDNYANYIASEPSPMVDPVGSFEVSADNRVYRGGSWSDDGKQGRSAFRYSQYVASNTKKNFFGLRLCLMEE